MNNMDINWQSKRVLIIGAARQGLALARYLARQGAEVTLNDRRTPGQLEEEQKALSGLPLRWTLGDHPLDLLDRTDLVCLSGGVPPDLPLAAAARQRGIPLSNDSQIFMESVPCRVIGITGSAGKTTTTTLLGRMAQAAIQPPHKAWVGGNIGNPLIDHLGEIGAGDTVILELSSFQLELMTRSPHIAAVLNITPNHLDRHGTLEAYTAAKARILDFQSPQSAAVLCREDHGSWGLVDRVHGRLVTFGLAQPPAGQAGVYTTGEAIWLRKEQGDPLMLLKQALIRLRGKHNLLNALAACAIAHAAGFSVEAMQAGIAGFSGVAHRLEFVRALKGAAWYNDSIATAPERTMAAIHSFGEPLVLLLGGRDKNLPWEDLAALIAQRVDHVIIFGEAAEKIMAAIGGGSNGQKRYSVKRCKGLHEAVLAAAEVVAPGDVVLLSPGGTSYDEFKDFEERGEYFRQWVSKLS